MTRSSRLLASRVLLALAALTLLFAAIVGASWLADRHRLREAAIAATASATSDSDRLTRLLHWVYANQGFAKNHHYFLWSKLEATPIQVMEHGGDCADKSKLFVTMLREIGIEGSLAMLYPCATCGPSHVVTLVKTGAVWTPMDAVFDITFPDGRGGFLDVGELKNDPSAMPARLDALVAERGAADKIALYKRGTEGYAHTTTMNWDKAAPTRAVAAIIRAAGGEPWRTPRPIFLDDPKQLFMLAGLAATLGLAVLALLARPRARTRR